MSKIRIVNWLLTRRCNLKCGYCAIVKNYKNKPPEYPDMDYYHKNEMSTEYIINCLKLFKKHNPEIFNIFYGGEPMLRKDLPEIINFCNENDIHYTIISNNVTEIQPLIKTLFEKTNYIQGFTSSVDPIFDVKLDNRKSPAIKTEFGRKYDKSTGLKSVWGMARLIEMKHNIKDVVAEITVMKASIHNLFALVQHLSDEGINSDVTFIDIAKNPYYDFSNITDEKLLVSQEEAKDQIDMLLKSDLNIHMKDKLLPKIYEALPSNMDCGIEKNLHNITIDADGSIRLCLRIRGTVTPRHVMAHEIFTKDDINKISPFAHICITTDKKMYCELCNHTCHLMSQIIDSEELEIKELVHLDIREE